MEISSGKRLYVTPEFNLFLNRSLFTLAFQDDGRVDLEGEWRVRDDAFRSRSTNSWLLGETLTGGVVLTIAGGATAFERLAVAT